MEYIQILTDFNSISIVVRLTLSIVLGGLIGIDREKYTRSAGFRTYSLVCLGATLVMLISNFLHVEYGNNSNADVARLGAQVISGIGFLGAGAIIVSGSQKVKGLTTAAALWTCACIGLAIGIGFYLGAIFSCLLTLVLLKTLRAVDRRYRKLNHYVDIYLEVFNSADINKVICFLKENNIEIVSLNSTAPKVATSEIGVVAVIKITKNQNSDEIMDKLLNFEYINLVHKVYI